MLEEGLSKEEQEDNEGLYMRMASFNETKSSRRKNNIDARRSHVLKHANTEDLVKSYCVDSRKTMCSKVEEKEEIATP